MAKRVNLGSLYFGYGVNYWVTGAKGNVGSRMGKACFSDLRYNDKDAKSIKYVCPLNGDKSERFARFWIRFLRRWLTDLKWTAEIVEVADKGGAIRDCILYNLKEVSGNFATTLTYLTAFRYPAEYSTISSKLWKNREEFDDSDAMFGAFQKYHYGSYYETGHSLITRGGGDGWGGGSSSTPISIQRFRDNLKSRKGTVHRHFS